MTNKTQQTPTPPHPELMKTPRAVRWMVTGGDTLRSTCTTTNFEQSVHGWVMEDLHKYMDDPARPAHYVFWRDGVPMYLLEPDYNIKRYEREEKRVISALNLIPMQHREQHKWQPARRYIIRRTGEVDVG